MNKITEASKALNDNLNLLNEAKILELEALICDLKSIIFNQEQLIERNRKYHNGTLLQLGKAKHVIDLMKIMLIGAEKQDFIIYPSSNKTPNYLNLIANKIAEYEK